MNQKTEQIKVIISGGGTGGHIFPALAIADEIRKRIPGSDILFVGADNRMEMEKVPAAGYEIIGLPVRGLKRKLTFENVGVIVDLMKSTKKARKIIRDFQPDVVIGVGGYASAPVLRAASKYKIPTLIQEQNSYAGVTNKLLARKASKICVAYPGMEKYFPDDKIVLTGNPVRSFELSDDLRKEGFDYFNLSGKNPVLLVIGGSLGARTVNNALLHGVKKIDSSKVDVIWQTGKYYHESVLEQVKELDAKQVQVHAFINRMDLAYNVADLVVSRAGALSISELCLVGKPSVLVPSPNVAEDHQTKNARALADVGAARMVADAEAEKQLVDEALVLLKDNERLNKIAAKALKMAKPTATQDIVDQIMKIAGGKE